MELFGVDGSVSSAPLPVVAPDCERGAHFSQLRLQNARGVLTLAPGHVIGYRMQEGLSFKAPQAQ